jgi:hypothetical protein
MMELAPVILALDLGIVSSKMLARAFKFRYAVCMLLMGLIVGAFYLNRPQSLRQTSLKANEFLT